MAAYRRVYHSRHLQAECQEPGSAPRTLRSVIEYGLPLPCVLSLRTPNALDALVSYEEIRGRKYGVIGRSTEKRDEVVDAVWRTVAGLLQVHLLSVTASDGGTVPLTSHTTVVVRVDDVNDNSPAITVNTLTPRGTAASVAENSEDRGVTATASAVLLSSGLGLGLADKVSVTSLVVCHSIL